MIYPNNFEQKIGFDQIRHILSGRCLSTLGKDKVEEMQFSAQSDEVTRRLDEVNEFVRIIQEEDAFPYQHFFDVRPALQRASIVGMYMDESELFDLRRSLDTISLIIKFLQPENLPNPSLYGGASQTSQSPLPIEGEMPEGQRGSFVVGSLVRIKGQQTIGTIEQINGKNATVTFGMMRTVTKLSKLEPATQEAARQQEAERPKAYTYLSKETQENISERRLPFKQDIDVRGMPGGDALHPAPYYLDAAVSLSMSRVRILHGTGNGILRTLIRQYLQANPAVASCRDEHVQFGGAGITVVDLN